MALHQYSPEGEQDPWQKFQSSTSVPAKPLKHYLQITSDLAHYRSVAPKIIALAQRQGFDNHELFAITLAVEEALINAIKHGNGNDARKKINIEYAVEVAEVYVKILDEGKGFEFAAIQNPLLPENLTRECGRGIYLMRSLMSEVRYNATGNEVQMWKYRTIAPPLQLEIQMGINTKKKAQKKAFAGKASPQILLAEDDREMRVLLAAALRHAGYGVIECSDGVELLEHLGSYILPGKEHEAVDLVISDIRMPGVTGLEILEGLSRRGDFPPFILITAFGDVETHAIAEHCGALAMFDKPFDVDDLVDKVRKVVLPLH